MINNRNQNQYLQDEFCIRYYEWALSEAASALQAGFPLVHQIRNDICTVMPDVINAFPTSERQSVMRALVRRFHPQALKITSDKLSERELLLIAQFDERRKNAIKRFNSRNLNPLWLARKEDRRVLRANIESALESVLGKVKKQGSSSYYHQYVGDWIIKTEVDFGHTIYDFSYSHDICAPNAPDGVNLCRFISVLAWLGLSSQTSWENLASVEYASAAATLSECCRRFLYMLPSLLQGL